MANPVFELMARIFLDTSDYDNGLDNASRDTESFGSKVKGGLTAVGKMGAAALAATTTAVAGFGVASVKTGMDFDASMSNVAAISGATGSDLESLRDKAKEMGATTQFSASEAADAMGYMAMAGWKTGDMLDGIGGIMSLAAASGEDLATTSDIVTDALTAFGLQASDSGHFADVLAAASSNANTNVSMLGESFKYVAPVAGSLGYTAEDTSIALGLMANSGIKASQAGTALRTLMTNMAKPTKQMATAMETLGVSLTDDEGNMKSLHEVMLDLRKGFSNLTESQQAEVAASLAGKEGMSGLLAIVNASEGDFNKLTDAIYNSNGAAEEMERVMNDNLAGDIKILKSAFEGLQIAISDELSPTFREFVQFGADGLSRLTTAFQEGGLTSAVQVFGELVSEGLQLIVDALPRAIEVGGQVLLAIAQGIGEAIPKLLMTAIELLSKLGDYLIQGASGGEGSDFGTKLAEIIIAIGKFLVIAIPKLAEAALKIVAGLAMMIISSAAELLKAAGPLIAKLVEGIGKQFKKLIEAGKDIVKKIVEGIKNKFNDVRNSGKDIVTKISDGIKNSFNTIKSKASELINAFKSKIVESAQNLISSGAEIVVKIAYGIGTGFNNITNKVYELKDKIVQAVEACASWWENLGYNIVRGIADGITKFGAWVKNAIMNLANEAWESIKSFFGIESPSKLMKWAGQMIDEGLAKGINDNSDDVQDAMDELNDIVSGPLDAGISTTTSYSDSRNAATTGGITINVYGAVGQDVNDLAEIVAQKLENAVQRKKAVFA